MKQRIRFNALLCKRLIRPQVHYFVHIGLNNPYGLLFPAPRSQDNGIEDWTRSTARFMLDNNIRLSDMVRRTM